MVNIFVFLPERNICSTRNIQICCWIPIKWTKKPGMWWRQSGFTEKDLIDQTYSVIRIYRSQLRNILLIGDDQFGNFSPIIPVFFVCCQVQKYQRGKTFCRFLRMQYPVTTIVLLSNISSCGKKRFSVTVNELLRLEITNKTHSLFALVLSQSRIT